MSMHPTTSNSQSRPVISLASKPQLADIENREDVATCLKKPRKLRPLAVLSALSVNGGERPQEIGTSKFPATGDVVSLQCKRGHGSGGTHAVGDTSNNNTRARRRTVSGETIKTSRLETKYIPPHEEATRTNGDMSKPSTSMGHNEVDHLDDASFKTIRRRLKSIPRPLPPHMSPVETTTSALQEIVKEDGGTDDVTSDDIPSLEVDLLPTIPSPPLSPPSNRTANSRRENPSLAISIIETLNDVLSSKFSRIESLSEKDPLADSTESNKPGTAVVPANEKSTHTPPQVLSTDTAISISTSITTHTSSALSNNEAIRGGLLCASELDLSILFQRTYNFEVWDLDESTDIFCPAFLFISPKPTARTWGRGRTSLHAPCVTSVDIESRVKRVPTWYSVAPVRGEGDTGYSVRYSGAVVHDDNTIDSTKGIHVASRWTRVYAPPGVANPVSIEDSGGQVNRTPNPTTGWYLKIWIPVPGSLFRKKETRIFDIVVGVWLKEAKDNDVDFGVLTAQSEMTVSHLRKERYLTLIQAS